MSETANAHAPVPLIPITGEALLYNQFYSSRKTVSTGIPKLDVLIGGGLLASEVIEFYGKSNSGKTQLCHKIISAVACRDEDDASALYLDLHCDFSIERLDKDALQGPALNNIRVMRHFGVTGLLRCLEFLEKELPLMQTPFYRKLRLVVIDSIPFALYCLSMEWPNPDRATEEKIAMTLKRLASNHKLTILVINHSINIRSDISTINRNFSKKTKPALGKYWLHIPNIRIHVCRENENEVALLEEDNFKDVPCRATLEKSGHGQPQRFFNFVLSKGDHYLKLQKREVRTRTKAQRNYVIDLSDRDIHFIGRRFIKGVSKSGSFVPWPTHLADYDLALAEPRSLNRLFQLL